MHNIESDGSSETNLIIVTKKYRAKLFCNLYWRTITILVAPIILLPIAFLGENNAYKCFYVFLLTSLYWATDAMHPSVVALVPIAMSTLLGSTHNDFLVNLYVRNGVLECLGTMMLIAAIEHSRINKRIALKLLLVLGCSHYRLSFLLFFCCMLVSMWISNTLACGLMMPLVKSVLTELEKMGILDVNQTIGKVQQKSIRHEQNNPLPTDFTVFYYLGIAYSASIGGMGTLVGSHTDQIFKSFSESTFPSSPSIEFPHFMLLNLPGVLLMETLLYMWMNFYFLGMFRAHSEIALEIGMTEEEAQYIHSLLSTQYGELGKVQFHEIVIGSIVILNIILQAITSGVHCHMSISSPTIVCVILLFIIPVKLDFLKFFRRHSDTTVKFLPSSPSHACLNWNLVKDNIHWSALFIIGGSCTMFDALKTSRMTDEFEAFLVTFRLWPSPAQALIVILICKLLTEFASNACVLYTVLPNIARLCVISRINPHYLMMSATLASSVPFHLITGSPPNAMVAAYVHIPPWKMMHAGIGPSVIAIVVIWFTVTLWSKAVWTDINLYPTWADKNVNFNVTSI